MHNAERAISDIIIKSKQLYSDISTEFLNYILLLKPVEELCKKLVIKLFRLSDNVTYTLLSTAAFFLVLISRGKKNMYFIRDPAVVLFKFCLVEVVGRYQISLKT